MGAAAVLLVVITTLVLRAAGQSPPAIAEFAPQAQQVKEAPQEQTALSGSGGGGAATGQASPSPAPSPPAHPQGTLLRCIGDPPRQTEDPQSPPCVPFWAGDNGGSTYHNVFANQLNIFQTSLSGNAQGRDTQCGGPDYPYELYLFRYFNERYETYNRTLTPICNTDDNPMGDASHQQADAVAADGQYHAFLATTYRAYSGFYFYDQMVKERLMVATSYPVMTESYMAAHDPYVWQYFDGIDREMAIEGQWICSRFAGRPAKYAGDLTYTGRTRTFAVYLDQENDPSLDYAPLLSALAACGVKPAYAFKTYSDGSTSGPSSEMGSEYANAIESMRSQNITTVVCLCLSIYGGAFATAAQSAGYNPEWILSSYFGQDFEWVMRELWPSTELRHAFGLSFQPPWHTLQDDPAAWAVREAGGMPPSDELDQFALDVTYRELLLAVSGIQLAGPHLTPASFHDGLQRAVFPNPVTSFKMGDVGFADSHGMTTDFDEFWWSYQDSGTTSEDTPGSGVICYPNAGARYSAQAVPRAPDQMFQEPCDPAPGG